MASARRCSSLGVTGPATALAALRGRACRQPRSAHPKEARAPPCGSKARPETYAPLPLSSSRSQFFVNTVGTHALLHAPQSHWPPIIQGLIGRDLFWPQPSGRGRNGDPCLCLDGQLTRLCLRPRRCIGWHGWCKWTPVEPAGTCPGYKSSKLDGSEDPWTTGARDEHSAIGGGSLA